MEFSNIDEAIRFLNEHLHLDRAPATFPPVTQYLGETHDIRALKPLLKALTQGGDYIRAVAASGLGILGLREAIPYLIETFRSDPGLYVRCDAALALGSLKAEEALPVFLQTFPQEAYEVQKRIIMATSEIDTESAKQTMKAIKHLLSVPSTRNAQDSFLEFLVEKGLQRLDRGADTTIPDHPL